jgi:hypothetical protein
MKTVRSLSRLSCGTAAACLALITMSSALLAQAPGGPGAAPAGQPGAGGPGGPGGRGGPGGPGGAGGGGRGGMAPFDFNDHTGYTQIFDGKSMDGWDYPPTVYRVEDGAIVAGYDPNMSTGTTFATYTKAEPADFDLVLDIKGSGNTGVQFRSFQNNITSPADGPSKAQLREIAKIDAGTVALMGKVVEARKALAAATFAQPVSDAALQAAAKSLADAEQALATVRADGFAALQASPNKLEAGQLAVFLKQSITSTAPIEPNAVWNVAGYQADFGGANTGNIWEGGRFSGQFNGQTIGERGNLTTAGNITITESDPAGRSPKILAKVPTGDDAGPFYKNDDWNQYRVLARGNTMALFLNGHLISMTIDDNPVMRRTKGIIALQIEGGKWYFKNIWLKEIK